MAEKNQNIETIFSEPNETLIKPTNEEQKKVKVPLSKLFYFSSKKDKVLMIIGFIASMANGAAMPLFSVIFGKMAESFSPTNPAQTVIDLASKYALYFVYLAIGTFACAFVMFACWMITGTKQAIEYRKAYFNALLQQEIGWYDKINPNQLATNVARDCQAVEKGIGEKVVTTTMFISTFFSGFIVGYTQGWKLALVLTASIPFVGFTFFMYFKVMINHEKWNRKLYSENSANAEESITAIRTVKVLSGENHTYNIFITSLNKAKYLTVKNNALIGIFGGFVLLTMFSDYALGFYYGSVLIENREWNAVKGNVYSMGDVLTVFFAILIGIMNLAQIDPALKCLIEGRYAAQKIWEVIERKPLIIIDETNKFHASQICGNIRFTNVDFSYPTQPEKQILNNINLEILVQKKNALVGKSGCGKTTIMQLIERFYDIQNGSVEIDNKDVREYNLESLRKHYVGQEPVLFASSIRENLKYGNENAEEEDIIEALKQANIWDDINKMTDKKLDTYVGVGGAHFSGGQKQRIAIARALLKKPEILLLDEATSALDRANELSIQNTLDEISVGRTTIVIAHRLSTVQNADRIFVIDEGRVVEYGTHSQLMQIENGIYKNLANTQMLEEKAEKIAEKIENLIDLEEKERKNSIKEREINQIKIEIEENEIQKTNSLTEEQKKQQIKAQKKLAKEKAKKLDGRNIKEYDLKTLRSFFGVVTQEPVLFTGTVYENIQYNTENVGFAEIKNAAKQANALEFIEKNEFDCINKTETNNKNFGEGFNRKVGNKGTQISGGQKQRIAIARALLKNPKILLLDEATSALDGPSEKIVQESLNQIMQNKTTITIAHRLSTIKNHDKLFVFNEGKIVEEGRYEELMTNQGYFYNFQKGEK